MAQEQAEIMLGVVSKSTEQTVSTALQETGDHAAMRLVASVEQFCDPVVLDGFPSIFVSFRGILPGMMYIVIGSKFNPPSSKILCTFTMMTVNLWDCWCKCRIHMYSQQPCTSKSLESERPTNFKWVKDGKGM